MTAAVVDRPVAARGDVAAAADVLRVAQVFLAAVGAAESWSAGERRAALEDVDRTAGLLAAVRARLLAAERAAGTWALHGDRDLAAWRARTSHAGVREAVGQLRQADAITTMPQVRDALTTGAITTTHVDAIARFTATASPQVAELARSGAGQAEIVALATRVDGAGLGKALTRWQAELDPTARQRAHDQQQAARYLNLSETPGGTYVKGLLDSVAGHRLRLALEAVSPRPGLDDERAPEQRRADALVQLADRALDDTGPATGPAGRPHVSLVLSESTWRALRAGGRRSVGERGLAGEREAADARGVAGRRAAADERASGGRSDPARPGAGSAVATGRSLVGVPPVCDEDGNPWPASEVGRVLCDCHVTRVVVDADSGAAGPRPDAAPVQRPSAACGDRPRRWVRMAWVRHAGAVVRATPSDVVGARRRSDGPEKCSDALLVPPPPGPPARSHRAPPTARPGGGVARRPTAQSLPVHHAARA
ncbi:hypothetical protein CELL_00016 [Cellulomonas sp. T2.31MG-18]|uniref:DUF222 domain-containing protein n=1 Tax=Cellulomonas sp. T2.31MG-18 TaxID=3157619 RepID=UPI0035E594C5